MLKRVLTSVALLCTLAFAVTADAQPRSRRQPPGRSPAAEPPPGHAKRQCNSQRAVLAQEEQQLDRYRADLIGIDSEVAQLERRLAELKKQRPDSARMVTIQENRVKNIKTAYDRDCSRDESCDQYEVLATNLGTQGSGVQLQLQEVRTEIEATRRETIALERRIQPLRTEYADKQCNNMVPGETAQETIDRCSAVFSEWNTLQAQLNRYNSRLPQLKSRYEELLAQLRSIQTRAQGYESYLAKNCSASPQVAEMRGYSDVRQNAEKLGKELDELITDVTRLRGIKITVTPK